MSNHLRITPVILILAALIGLSVALFWTRIVETQIAVWSLAIIWISVLPGLIHVLRPSSSEVPFFPASGAFYAIFFGFPAFAIPLAWTDSESIVLYSRTALGPLNPEIYPVVFLGILSSITTFFIFRRWIFLQLPRFRIRENINHNDYKVLLFILLLVHIAHTYLPLLGVTFLPRLNSALAQIMTSAGFIAFGGLFLLWRRGQLQSKLETIVCLAAFILEVYFRLHELFLTKLVLITIFLLLLFWREDLRKLIVACSILLVGIVSIYGVSTALRHASNSAPERLAMAARGFMAQMISGDNKWEAEPGKVYDFQNRFGALAHRTSGMWVFQIVDQLTPEQVPYWKGETYRPLALSFIPRIIYPNKLEERTGSAFGMRYGLLKPHETRTSVNLPWITELLANFGRSGVIWGMALIGIFLAALDRVFNSRGSTDLEFVIGLTLLFPLIYPESNFSVMTGSILPLTIVMFLYFVVGNWVLSKIPRVKN